MDIKIKVGDKFRVVRPEDDRFVRMGGTIKGRVVTIVKIEGNQIWYNPAFNPKYGDASHAFTDYTFYDLLSSGAIDRVLLEERMKLEKDDENFETITMPDDVRAGKREVCLFDALKKVGFFRNDEGPSFTLDELRELLPYLQRAVEHNSFGIPPKYELVELCEDTFAIRKAGTGRFYSKIPFEGWRRTIAFLFTKKEAEIVLEELENEK